MSIVLDVQVGPRIVADGSENAARSTRSGEIAVSDAHGRYQEAAFRGNVWFAGTNVAISFGATLTTTTALGLVISNPIGSKVNLVLLALEFVPTTAVAAIAGLSIMPPQAANVTHTTASTNIVSANGSLCSPTAKIDTGATLPAAPTPAKILSAVLTTTLSNTPIMTAYYDLGGCIVIPPGGAAALLATATVSGLASVCWEEIPI